MVHLDLVFSHLFKRQDSLIKEIKSSRLVLCKHPPYKTRRHHDVPETIKRLNPYSNPLVTNNTKISYNKSLLN